MLTGGKKPEKWLKDSCLLTGRTNTVRLFSLSVQERTTPPQTPELRASSSVLEVRREERGEEGAEKGTEKRKGVTGEDHDWGGGGKQTGTNGNPFNVGAAENSYEKKRKAWNLKIILGGGMKYRAELNQKRSCTSWHIVEWSYTMIQWLEQLLNSGMSSNLNGGKKAGCNLRSLKIRNLYTR